MDEALNIHSLQAVHKVSNAQTSGPRLNIRVDGSRPQCSFGRNKTYQRKCQRDLAVNMKRRREGLIYWGQISGRQKPAAWRWQNIEV